MAEKAKFDREAAFKSIIGAGRQSENAVAAEENNGKKFQKEHQKKLKYTYKEQKEFETIDDDFAKLDEKIEQ